MMPEKDGIEVLGEMRGLKDTPNYKTPIICLTANAISGMSEMYIKAGFDDYMTKPIDPDRLEGMLLQYLPKEKVIPALDEGVETGNVDNLAMVGNTGDTYGIDGVLPDFIRNINSIDVATGIKHCGSGKAYLITLKKFLDTAEKNADEIEAFWAANDIKNTTIKVHALKSTSRIIGALELGDFAAKLEKAGDSDDIIILEEELPELISQYRKLAKELEPLNNQEKTEGDDERPVISNEELNETYRKLLEYCANFAFDSVVCVAQTLEKYQIPKEETERVEAILKAVDDFDYDKIPGVINREE
jgi:CheY-like chemotaxis protein